MINEKYEQAKAIIKSFQEHEDIYFENSTSTVLITDSEEILGVRFPETYRKFLEDFGVLAFGSLEVFGISTHDLYQDNSYNAIKLTLDRRSDFDLPNNFVTIASLGNGMEYYLDCDHLKNGHNCVKLFWRAIPINDQEPKIVADDFGEFLLEEIQLDRK